MLQWVKDSKLNLVTVDFSLNSPGICIWQSATNSYHFISYLEPKTGTKAEQRMQEDMDMFPDVSLLDQPDWKASIGDYSKNEFAKIIRYKTTADHLLKLITGITQTTEDYHIAFEGSSYGSNTNNIIDMAAGAAILKQQMIAQLEVKTLLTVAPTTIKKHAGKGNMNKAALWVAFLNNVCESKELAKSTLHKYCVSEIGEVARVPKPFDDLVDAWFLNHYLHTQLEGNLPD